MVNSVVHKTAGIECTVYQYQFRMLEPAAIHIGDGSTALRSQAHQSVLTNKDGQSSELALSGLMRDSYLGYLMGPRP